MKWLFIALFFFSTSLSAEVVNECGETPQEFNNREGLCASLNNPECLDSVALSSFTENGITVNCLNMTPDEFYDQYELDVGNEE